MDVHVCSFHYVRVNICFINVLAVHVFMAISRNLILLAFIANPVYRDHHHCFSGNFINLRAHLVFGHLAHMHTLASINLPILGLCLSGLSCYWPSLICMCQNHLDYIYRHLYKIGHHYKILYTTFTCILNVF